MVERKKINQRTDRTSPWRKVAAPALTHEVRSSPADIRPHSRRDAPQLILTFHYFRGPTPAVRAVVPFTDPTDLLVDGANASLVNIMSGARLSFLPWTSLASSLNGGARVPSQLFGAFWFRTLRQAHSRASPIPVVNVS